MKCKAKKAHKKVPLKGGGGKRGGVKRFFDPDEQALF